MDKQTAIAKLAESDEDKILLARVYDRMTTAEQRCIPAASCFLTAREQVLVQRLLPHLPLHFFGGCDGAERAVCCYVPEYLEPADCRGDRMYPLAEADAAYPADGKLSIDELTFTVWRTPGHTPGSVCLYCNGLLFSGDTLFAGSCGRTDLPGGSSADMRRSLSLLAGLPLPDQTQVLPGHGGDSTMGEEKRQNPYLLGAWV